MKLCVIVCLQVVLAGGLSKSVSQKLDPEVLLEKYNLCNKEFETISYDLESVSESRRRRFVYTVKHCARNESKQWIGHRTLYMYDEHGNILPGTRERVADTYDGTQLVSIFRDHPSYHPKAILYRNPDGLLPTVSKEWTDNMRFGGPLVGKIFGSNYQSVYDLLKGAYNIKLHDTAKKILNHDAYLIEADTKYGIVKAWISPELDYNCLRWEIIKKQNQFYRDGTNTNDWFTNWKAVYDAEKVEQINGRYITTQAKFKYNVIDGDTKISDFTHHYKLTNIDFDPDYEEMGAFKIQVPEGTIVLDKDFPGIQYQWIGGQLQPLYDDIIIDALDSAVDELKENRKAIPAKQVEDSKIDSAVEQTGKADSKQLSDRVIARIENKEKNGINIKKIVFYMISVFLIMIIVFFAYRHTRRMRNNANQE